MGRSEKCEPCIWFVCKLCGRAYQRRKHLVRHKRQVHPRAPLRSPLQRSDSDEVLMSVPGNDVQQDEKLSSDTTSPLDDPAEDDVDGDQVLTEPDNGDEGNLVINLSVGSKGHERRAGIVPRRRQLKTHKCEFCGKILSSKGSLEVHSRLHTGFKPFSCQFCRKSFALKGNCQVHERIHTGERPYHCTVDSCTKSFTQASQLKSHAQSVHGFYLTRGPGRPRAVHPPTQCRDKTMTSGEDEEVKSRHLTGHSPEEPLELTTTKRTLSVGSTETVQDMLIDTWKATAAAAALAVVTRQNDTAHVDTKRRLFECRFCPKTFAAVSTLLVHERNHTTGQEQMHKLIIQNTKD